MKRNMKYPLKHISIRVPWHDNGWNGTICNNPKANNSCLILKNCALSRDDEAESRLAGQRIEHLTQSQFPSCVRERGTFMSDFSFTSLVDHPYKKNKHPLYQHFKPTPLRHSAYCASAVPFNWMQRENAQERANHYDLPFDISREPDLSFSTNWIQEYENQKAMLDCFFEHLQVQASLCFFYAKDVPFVEASGRVLIGVGRIKYIGDGVEYEYDAKGSLRSMLWEHQIQHSIRPDFNDGFLLPYHEAMEYVKDHPQFNPADIAVITPSDNMMEFSYASEHVSHDTAIRALLQCVKSLEKANELHLGDRDWDLQIQWVEKRINELEKIRGLYPGLGSALCAFGVEHGHFIAREIMEKVGEGDPWPVVNQLFNQPESVISSELVQHITPMLRKRWKVHRDDPRSIKIDLLQLISRFEITIEQAKAIYVEEERQKYDLALTDQDILKNPYLIYEQGEKLEEPISFWTIDLGLLPKKTTEVDLLPRSVDVNDPLDIRRIRSLTIHLLRMAKNDGNTLLSRQQIVQQIRDMPLKPPCPVSGDLYEIEETYITEELKKVKFMDGALGYQLNTLHDMGQLIQQTVIKRQNGKRHDLTVDWQTLIDAKFGETIDEIEIQARKEKSAALKELSDARLSVLVGPAGTGKTTLLSMLCQLDEIRKDGILFLAPTGKARVRMQEVVQGLGIEAYTLAQFLSKYKRYDPKVARYELSNFDRCSTYGTVIVDESSMLTEEMLAALIDSLKGVKRLILVGDFRQLPPIGAGRPFVDIVNYLQPENIETLFPRVAKSYAELTIPRRQIKGKEQDEDLQDSMLAKWFSGGPLDSGEDVVFQNIALGNFSNRLNIVLWKNGEDFEQRLKEVLVKELKLNGIDDIEGFNKFMGSVDGVYFNDSIKAAKFKQKPAVEKLDDWQILSPIRGSQQGTQSINRLIHKLFRKDKLDYANGLRSKYAPKIPKPLGTEEIVYGDKVINISNHHVYHKRVYPNNGLNYLANGEMGYVVGQFKTKYDNYNGQPKYSEVEFSSQKGYKYTFYSSDFKDEGEATLELAYAITIHKSQGSEFKMTIIVIPHPCFNLSRELLYTALTRQTERVVIMYQGDSVQDLKKYTSPLYSETYARITNLFNKPLLQEIAGRYLEQYLIHCASDNTLLRSKSELIIYEQLLAKGLSPIYEKELTFNGFTRIPDFTIINDDTGETYYWEHCGMLNNSEYQRRWEEKQNWYYENGILPLEDGGGPNGTLIVTSDSSNEGISIPEIAKIVEAII